MLKINPSLYAFASIFLLMGLGARRGFAAFIPPLKTDKTMVVSANPLASDAGLQMLQKNGNAVDAAVATALAISVVEPFSAGIGGGGFLLFHQGKTGKIKALDFRERAPLKATRNMYLDAQGKVRLGASRNGHLAVGTPGTVAGLHEIHQRYGKLPWSQVVQPAIRLADAGFILNPVKTPRSLVNQQARKPFILANPAARAIFTRNNQYYQPGERLVQKDLARTLKDIARDYRSFYTGRIAQAIAADMKKNAGLITLEDLRQYKPIWRQPVCGNFRQHRVCSMPPPSSGGVHLLQMLNIIGNTWFRLRGWHHADNLHLLAEAMKIAYADRSEYLGDPDFVRVPTQALISPEYGKFRRRQINLQQATPSSQIKPVPLSQLQKFSSVPLPARPQLLSPPRRESNDTSHLSVVDSDRNAVSLTFTINTGFGAAVVAEGTGIVLNNEMDDFAIAPGVPNAYGLIGNDANSVAPLKTPLSSMTPTIVTRNNQLRVVVGTPGGSTIITQVLQILLNILEFNMDAGAAVSAPRIHHQWLPDRLVVEPWGLDALTLKNLCDRGHKIKQGFTRGNANVIIVKPDNTLEGAADPRGEGAARGF